VTGQRLVDLRLDALVAREDFGVVEFELPRGQQLVGGLARVAAKIGPRRRRLAVGLEQLVAGGVVIFASRLQLRFEISRIERTTTSSFFSTAPSGTIQAILSCPGASCGAESGVAFVDFKLPSAVTRRAKRTASTRKVGTSLA